MNEPTRTLPRDASIFARSSDSVVCIGFLGVALALRVAFASRYRVSSDEPQHLHVVWAWTQHLLPYRDVFDNHMPLFHALYAPVLRALGERPDILVAMRLAMVPLWAGSLVALYALGRTLFDARTARWGVVFAALDPATFLASLEFRTDDLWALFWLAALAVLLARHLTVRRGFAAGLLLGAAFGVSLKSVLLLAGLAAGAVVAAATGRVSWRRLVAPVAAGIAGTLVVPAAIVAFFTARGAFASLYYCTIAHQVVPRLGGADADRRGRLLVPCAAAIAAVAWLVHRTADRPEQRARRVLVVVAAGVYAVVVGTLWPLWTRQDRLPVGPVAALLVAPLVCALGRGAAAPAVVALVLTGALVREAKPWRVDASETALLRDVLQLTTPDDLVMDTKGETVFRHRPYWWVLESVTRLRVRRGLLPDDVPETLVATGTPVATAALQRYSPRTRAFLTQNYVVVGELRVVGRRLGAAAPGVAMPFPLAVPAEYAVLGTRDAPTGLLDGTPYTGPRRLVPGPHVYAPVGTEGDVSVLWARAAERGFVPLPDPETMR